MTSRLPLDGVRVIDLTRNWAGPQATTVLADMGAEVIKLEFIGHLDITRGAVRPWAGSMNYPDQDPGERPWNRASFFNAVNRNKLGITLDIFKPQGLQVFEQLIRMGDVLMENFPARLMKRHGLEYTALQRLRPDLIMVSMPAFGSTGPYSSYGLYGWGVAAIAGHTSLNAYPDEPPLPEGFTLSDPSVGLYGALAAVMALHHRLATGEGQFIDLSHVESHVPLIGEMILDYTMNGTVAQPSGNRSATMVPHGCFRCKGEDSWVAIAVRSEEEWDRFCVALGNPDWARDPRFASLASRRKHEEDLNRAIETWTAERGPYEVMQLLQQHGVPAGPVLGNREVLDDPHVNARSLFQTVTHPDAGTHAYTSRLWKLSKASVGIRSPANTLGEHSQRVLGELLGLSNAQIAQLEEAGVSGTVPIGADVPRKVPVVG